MATSATAAPDARVYLEHLEALPFVRSASLTARGKDKALTLALSAHGRKYVYDAGVLRTHLSVPELARWIGVAHQKPAGQPLMLLVPYVSAPMGLRLREAGVQYVDQAGNMHVQLSATPRAKGALVALVEGKRAPRTKPSDTAWRAPSYQVLLALLAQPSLVAAPVRSIAAQAGVSTSPVLHVQKKLAESAWLVDERGTRTWTPRGRDKAVTLWLHGYHSTLRPQLMVGQFRPRTATEPAALEAHVAQTLRGKLPFWWGGAAAAQRLDGYYRGDRTVVHVDAEGHSVASLAGLLRMVPDPDGPLVVLRLPGPAAIERADAPTVHPLLAWAELLEEDHDRASEAAERLERTWRA